MCRNQSEDLFIFIILPFPHQSMATVEKERERK